MKKPSQMTIRRRANDLRGCTSACDRSGHVLVLFAILLPVLIGILGLVIDSSLMNAEFRNTQHIADAAAMAAAYDKSQGHSDATARATAIEYVQDYNGLGDADVTVNRPPNSGPYAGKGGYVEVIVAQQVPIHFLTLFGNDELQTVRATGVAGFEPATAGIAVMALDQDPEPITVQPVLPLLGALPALLGGIEVLGIGGVEVEGAVVANTKWGGVDENGDPAGDSAGPPWGISCMPILPLTQLRAQDIYVVGGVDDPDNYGHADNGEPSPLQANKLPVADPLIGVPVPTIAADSTNVNATLRGGVTVVGLPLVGTTTVLEPGVYEWIQITAGRVRFEPGVYIIRNVNPVTQIALSILAGQVEAEGVMFYITNSPGYLPTSGAPDINDGETEPAAPGALTLLPSAVINIGVLGSNYSPIDDPSSPFDGMLIFQRRQDRRPMALIRQQLLGSDSFAGIIYSKWGHLIFGGYGSYDATLVAGTIRFVNVLGLRITPYNPLPPVEEVFLVQ